MNDIATGMITTSIVIVMAVGAALRKDIVGWLRAKRRKVTTDYAALSAWPTQSQILPCESWVGREIAAPVIAEAEGIAEKAWLAWKPEQVEESSDD